MTRFSLFSTPLIIGALMLGISGCGASEQPGIEAVTVDRDIEVVDAVAGQHGEGCRR